MAGYRFLVAALGIAIASGSTVASPLLAQEPATEVPLPVQRVVLYKSGIGYFEHVGQVNGNRDVTVSFTSAQLDDVLKTLTVLDLDGGRVTDIGYNSLAPIEQRLRNVRLPIGATPTFFELLSALRGAAVEVRAGAEATTGRVLSAERHERAVGDTMRSTEEVSIVTDDGEVRRFEFGPQVSVRLLDEDLRQEMFRYLRLLESTREEDVRRLTISTQGSGDRSLFVSYVSEVPIWKSSYRIVMPSESGDGPILQGWAIVDNTIGEDWEDVELSLVSGAPQSFIQQISQPYYARRQVVPVPEYAQSSPQTHGATLTEGSGRLAGSVSDADGAPLPGVRVDAVSSDGETVTAFTGSSGAYRLSLLPAGTYNITFALQGFSTETTSATVRGGQEVRRDARLDLSAVQETVTVRGDSRSVDARLTNLAAEATPEMLNALPTPRGIGEALMAQQAQARGDELGDLFEYRITDPVTIRRNQSALVPILRAEVAAEKVSLWDAGRGSGRPLRALWLTNASDFSLDGGSFTVLEDSTFAGEGLLDPMEPGEKRLLSYGTDLAMQVTEEVAQERGAVTRVTAQRGVLIYESDNREQRTYTVRNEDSRQRTLIVEHPNRPGWEITSEALPEETAPGVYRFRLVVEPQVGASLTVAESRPLGTRVALSDVTDEHVALLVQQGVSRQALEQALRPIFEKKAELAALITENNSRNVELGRIVRDQERVRENIGALGSSAEERNLVQRYVQQLEEQEDRLAVLRREIAAADGRLDALQGELRQLIETLSVEIDPAR